ncbi:MAG: glucose/arabinose dehydrogenase [Halioglobus sp.]|jgi:glucose/arabinose dehydrogenase
MRKILIGLGLLILVLIAAPLVMLASGTIDRSSLLMLLNNITGAGGPAATEAKVRQRYQVPEGFNVQLYVSDLPKARFMHFTTAGDLLVSRPHAGDIILLRRDANGDGSPDGRETLIEGLKRPLGLETDNNWLYIAESNRIGRILFDAATGSLEGPMHTVIGDLTDEGNHWSKTIRIGPDKKLYLAQGSTCNVCEEEDTRRATLMRFALDGSAPETIATGLRNSVGFDWAPFSGELFATDNGRDLLGDNFPHCELNRIEDGGFYGWPYFNDDNQQDPDMGEDPLAGQRDPIAPSHNFRPHNAPLGITFLRGDTLPEAYKRTALVALHGSWNRSSPDGYKVVSLHFGETVEAGEVPEIQERDFLSGFNAAGEISGRPVDVAQGPGGAIYVSDDYAGAIYRISYDENLAAATAPMVIPIEDRLDSAPPGWLAEANLPDMSERGAALYQQYGCASCHEQGENPNRLDDLAQRLGYSAVIDTLTAPPSPMPVLPLRENDKRDLAVFLLGTDSEESVSP